MVRAHRPRCELPLCGARTPLAYGYVITSESAELVECEKAWVMFQTRFLTFTIYVGSAIYTAGIPSIPSEFHAGTVAATVGLTLFVACYGLG